MFKSSEQLCSADKRAPHRWGTVGWEERRKGHSGRKTMSPISSLKGGNSIIFNSSVAGRVTLKQKQEYSQQTAQLGQRDGSARKGL